MTFTSTVTAVAPGAGSPSGSVTFFDGGSPIGSGNVVGGVATYSTSTLPVGSHTITASYGADGNFFGSNGSLPSAQIVNKANTVDVADVLAESIHAEPVGDVHGHYFRRGAGAGTPGGTVTFLDGGNPIGSGILAGGIATLSTSSLAVGNHTITTTYPGDGNFNGGSGALSGNPQVVKKAPTTTTLTTSLESVPVRSVPDLHRDGGAHAAGNRNADGHRHLPRWRRVDRQRNA